MTDTPKNSTAPEARPDAPRSRRTIWLASGVAALALVGATAAVLRPDRSVMATPLQPTPIASLQESGAIAARGDVAEIFGNKFILQDKTGRALVETGPRGEDGTFVAKGEAVEVTGRFEHGFLHAAALTHADGKRVVLGPLAPPPGPLARAGEHLGMWPQADVAGLTAAVQKAGYTDVRVTGRGPRHLEVTARDNAGHDRDLHVDLDGQVRDAP